MLAERINQLDHITRGRVLFGCGPGALVSDAMMMGIEPVRQRGMMDEALGVLVPLMRGETVTAKTDWFTLNQARLHLAPYTRPSVEIAVANQVSPTGARAAGKHGISLLSLGATTTGGFSALGSTWAIAEDMAREHGTSVDRSGWRLVGPVHVAETREQARANVRFGLDKWLYYFREIAALPVAPMDGKDPVDALIESGIAVIGTPDDCIAQIERLEKQSGGFGCFLQLAHNWANWEATRRSYELVARYVMPRFQGLNTNREDSLNWARESHQLYGPDDGGGRFEYYAAHPGKGYREHPATDPEGNGHEAVKAQRRLSRAANHKDDQRPAGPDALPASLFQSHKPCHHGVGFSDGFIPALRIAFSTSHPVRSARFCASLRRRRSSSSK